MVVDEGKIDVRRSLLGRCQRWAAFSLLVLASVGSACPFCLQLGKTQSELVNEAEIAAFGLLSNPYLNPSPAKGQPEGTTDFSVQIVLKGLTEAPQQRLVLAKYLPLAKDVDVPRLVFAERVGAQIDPYRVMRVESKDFVDYLKQLVDRKNDPTVDRLRFLFGWLNHADEMIAEDAYKEFAKAPYAAVAAARAGYDGDKLVGWIRDPRTPGYRVGLYGLMLGLCGRASDVAILRELSQTNDSHILVGLDGVIGGLCVLDPSVGAEIATALLTNPAGDFSRRYAALQAIRVVLAEMPQVDPAKLWNGLTEALTISDISDIIVDEFRKRKNWNATARILALADPSQPGAGVREAVVRFALACPEPAAKSLIDRLRTSNPQLVASAEQNLRFEADIEREVRRSKNQ